MSQSRSNDSSKLPIKLPASAEESISRLVAGLQDTNGWGSITIEIHFKDGKLGGVTISQKRSFVGGSN